MRLTKEMDFEIEQTVLNKKTLVVAVITGITAIFVAVLWSFIIIRDLDHIRFIIVWDAIGRVSVFDIIDYLSILNRILVKPIVTLAAMILLALHVLIFYGRKCSHLLGLSAIILIIWGIITFAMNAAVILMDVILRMQFSPFCISLFDISFAVDALSGFLITLSFVILFFKNLDKIKFSIKFIPLVALIISVAVSLILSLIDGYFSSLIIELIILDISYVIPFSLFVLFCPIPGREHENYL